MQKNKGLWIIAIYLFLSLYLQPIYPFEKETGGEQARWATAASLIEKSSFDVGWLRGLTNESAPLVRIGDRFYAAQAPGAAVAAAPFYAVSRLAVGPPSTENMRFTWAVMRFFIASLPLLLLAFWLYAHESDELSLAVLLFATPLFLHSLALSAAPLVAVLLYFAFRLIYDTERVFLRNCLLAGFLSGAAVVCEFAAIVPIAVFVGGLFFLSRRDRWSSVFVFAVGAAPSLALLLFYNYWIFGAPLAPLYGYQSFSDDAETARLAYLSAPGFYNLYLLLFSPSRGLFFYSPILLLAVLALLTSPERKQARHRVKAAAVVLSVLAGSFSSDAAFSAGSFVLVLPLVLDSIFDGEIYELSNLWQGFLFTVSLILCALPAFASPYAPAESVFPHNDFWRPLIFRESAFAPNAFGFAPNVWTILPVAALLFIVLYCVWRGSRRPVPPPVRRTERGCCRSPR